jgi:nucleotide-binding universal stress UspA family protein
MSTIIVGVDFSPESEIAIAHAVVMARRLGTTVTLALATQIIDSPEGLSPGLMASYVKYGMDLKVRLSEDLAKLGDLREQTSGQGVDITEVVLDGLPEDQLPVLAKQLNASMVAVGTHGRTGFRRLSMGSIAERVVRAEERPVLVARGPAPQGGGYQRVVLGLDFSPPSRKAVQAARRYLAPGGKLDLIHCWQLPMWSYASSAPLFGDNVAQFQSELLANVQETGKKWLGEIGDIDGEVEFHSLERSPAAGLDAWATDHGADLIVVGSHGYRGLQRWLIGSVAEAVVRHAPCSVVVVH